MKVWVVLGTEDDGTDSGYRYVSHVFDSAEKAAEYESQPWYVVEEMEIE